MSVDAYQRARKVAEPPRATEVRLVSEITREMLSARDAGASGAALMPVLHRNRELWSVFATHCACPGNQLPAPLRASLISIALWVDRYTSGVVAGRDSIDPLLAVNRSLIEGLAMQTRRPAA
jgi:flagellar protein FlaF